MQVLGDILVQLKEASLLSEVARGVFIATPESPAGKVPVAIC